MDHQEKHHEQHRKEREHQKEHAKQEERQADNQVRVIHPLWFVVLGGGLLLAVVATWILATSHFFAG